MSVKKIPGHLRGVFGLAVKMLRSYTAEPGFDSQLVFWLQLSALADPGRNNSVAQVLALIVS